MIYDCFSFFNELDLLELRLNILNPVVDRFVIAEATRTHQKKEKPLYFQENKERFKPFLHKIEHVIVDTYPTFWNSGRPKINTWHYEKNQRKQIMKGLSKCGPEDMIIVSDLDEIPNPELVKKHAGHDGDVVFDQYMFMFYLNMISTSKKTKEYELWPGTVMTKFKNIDTINKVRLLRNPENLNALRLPFSGWHFTYMGGVDKIITKLESFAHKEFNYEEFKSADRVQEIINKGEDLFNPDVTNALLKDEKILPEYLLKNKSKYPHLFA
jgi:beta-1,4-mannosyl-glycoprotein beta-1,4-N-acetylglucosaminyltransferase